MQFLYKYENNQQLDKSIQKFSFKRLVVEEIRSVKAEPRAMIMIDQDENGDITESTPTTCFIFVYGRISVLIIS